MYRSALYLKYIPPGILAISLALIYLASMAPGLTWANSGSDGGDLIAAAATGGVAHPSGYPLFLLLAQFFQLLPFGSLAFRTNLMSAIATVLAAVLVYGLVARLFVTLNCDGYWLAGLVSGYAFGLSPLIWSQAVITEVYALHALFVVLILYLSTSSVPPSMQKRLDCLRGLALGLAMGNHVTIIILIPVILLANVVIKRNPVETVHQSREFFWRNWRLDWRCLLRQSAGLGAGLLIYLILPLRALSHPPVNWGNPISLGRLWWLVSGQLYQDRLLHWTILEIWGRLQAWASLLLQQFGLLGLMAGLIGLVVFFTPSRLYFITLWTMVTFSAFAVSYSSVDSYVYLIPAFISFAIWIGLGTGSLMEAASRAKRWHSFGRVISLGLIIYLLGLSVYHWPQVDASHDLRAENFGKEVLAAAPTDAIVFAQGDRAVFTMWYFHFALQKRPDIAVLATDLLHFDWYQAVLRSVYPSLVLPEPPPWPGRVAAANPQRPVCYVQYSQQAEINCGR